MQALMRELSLSEHSVVVAVQGQVSADLAGEAVVLNLQSGVYYGLNEVGARIWELIQQPTSVVMLCETLLAEYEVEPERCQQDLLQICQDLIASGLAEVL